MIGVAAQVVGEYLEHESARALCAIGPHAITHLRQAKRRGETKPEWWHSVLLADPCAYCGRRSEHIDHIHPRALAGSDRPSNLVGACGHCNITKSASPLLSFLLERRA